MDDLLMSKQFLTFKLEEQFAINVGHVLEVLEYSKITRLPNTPVFMSGVINNRGMVVPIINLRIKFNMEDREASADTSFVIIEINNDDESINVGLLVDSVQEVITFENEQIEPPPRIGMPLDTQYIQGIGKMNDDFIIILNIEKILSSEEIIQLREREETDQQDDEKKEQKKTKAGKEKQSQEAS